MAFGNKPALDLNFDKLNVLDEQTVAFTSELGKCYEGFTATVDIPAILQTLGAASLNDVTIFAVQPDGALDDNYKLGTTDGWRNAEGGWQGWGGSAYLCVKTDFSAASNQIWFVGGMDGNTSEPATYTATFAFVKNETADAVLLKVTLTYGEGDGIVNISTDKDVQIFDLMGRKVNRAQKGLYIIDGQKAVVK